jgi:RNA polymerase sigma-70 factor (ECF subfamily)
VSVAQEGRVPMSSSSETIAVTASSTARAFAAGQVAWPRLLLEPDQFACFLTARGLSADVPSSLAADLYLACACEVNLSGAVDALMHTYRPSIAQAASAYDKSPQFADEVAQRLGEILFVGRVDAPGRIGQYNGQGPLGAWIATAVRRIAVRLVKANATGKFVGEEVLAKQFSQSADPDIEILRGRYKQLFDEAIVTALRRLSSRERLILRLNMVEGISMDRIAKMHGVSQPTISRWLQQSRLEILRTVRDLVRDDLDVDDGEFDSLLRLLRSQVDFSFSRLLTDSRETLTDHVGSSAPAAHPGAVPGDD